MLPRRLILAGFALLSAGSIAAQEPQTAQPDTLSDTLAVQEPQAYEVRPGDRITLQLYTAAGQRVEVVEGERTVNRAGEVFLPFVGTIHIAGLEQQEIRRILREAYGAYYSDPVLDLTVQLRISVTGAVRDAGQFYLDPTATLAGALAVAGGVTPEFAASATFLPSDPRRVRLVRDGVATVLNFRAQEVSRETMDMRIKSGDWLHVPYQRRSRIRDEVQFWGSLIAVAGSTVSLIYLITR